MWYYKEETGNFAVGSIPMKETTIDDTVTYEEETGWMLITDRPEPYDNYIFDGVSWIAKVVKKDVPLSITMRQTRLMLLQLGMLTQVDATIMSSSNEALKIEWEYATVINRNWSGLTDLITLLSLTEDKLDDMFISAILL